MSQSIDTSRPMTVLFHVQDREAFKALADQFFDSMRDSTLVQGAFVTAISTEDEFARVERMEEAGYVD